MKAILIATSNPGKFKELIKGLETLNEKGIKLLSLKELDVNEKPQENGKTFQDNALIKARFYARKTGLPTIADDGGLTIDILKGAPGVKSRRWTGYEATDEELIKYTLYKLKNVPLSKRHARLTACLCYYNPLSKKKIFKEQSIKGRIASRPVKNWTKGYPYRALFIVDKYKKYYDELTDEEHEIINHRLRAARKLARSI